MAGISETIFFVESFAFWSRSPALLRDFRLAGMSGSPCFRSVFSTIVVLEGSTREKEERYTVS